MATTVPGTEVRNITLKRIERMAGHHPQCTERIEVDYLFGGKRGHDHRTEHGLGHSHQTRYQNKKKPALGTFP